MTNAKRGLPWLLILAAVLLAAGWGVDAFVLSDVSPTDPGAEVGALERPQPSEGAAGAPVRTEARPGPGLGPATRLEEGRVAFDEASAAVAEVAARPVRPGAEGSADGDPGEEAPGALRPGVTAAPGGPDVIVGNTFALAVNDEVWVEPGTAWIGTPTEQIEGLLGTRTQNVPQGIRYEAPRHAVRMEGFWIGRTEVSNRIYLRFLQQAARVDVTTPVGEARSPLEIVAALVGPRAPHGWDREATARQLVRANQAGIHAAVPWVVVRDPRSQAVDEEATWAELKDEPLPDGVRLRFYDRAPPAHWPDDRFAVGRVDHPVRGLSLEDATALALWSGRHVPSEIEWEYAARGPQGLRFPWGNRGDQFDALVAGGRPLGEALPETVPVRSLPDGASWAGAWQMLGNVAEWTSSRLDPYPESGLEPLRREVYRGGSVADGEPLVVRPAYRGWVPPVQEDAGPAPWNQRRPWVGVRLARYEEPVRSVTVAMRTWYRSHHDLPADAVERDVFAGVQGLLEGTPGGVFADPAARPGTQSVVVQPLRFVVTIGVGDFRVPGAVRDERQLLALSEAGWVFFGVLHTDLEATRVWQIEPRPGRRPRLVGSTCRPGTWLVGLHDEHLVLVDPASGELRTLTRTRAGPGIVAVRRTSPRRDGLPHLVAKVERIERTGRVAVALELPLGNPDVPDRVVHVRFDLRFEPRVLRSIRDWESGSFAR